MRLLRILIVLLLGSSFGCMKKHSVNDQCVAAIVKDRIGKDIYWIQQPCEDPFDWAVNCLLENELTVDSAVQVALFNNPEIQAVFEDVGIAHADLVQAGLFQNPIFDGYIRFPNKPLSVNTAFSVAQTFLDIFMIPLRQKVAAVECRQVQLRVANAVLDLSFDVEETYYRLLAEQKKLHLIQSLIESAEAAKELAFLQNQQGNINDLELQSRVNEYLAAKLLLSSSCKELVRLREHMNQLLGLFCTRLCWKINQEFPCIPSEEPLECCLESIALFHRLDLQIARWEVERFVRMGAVSKWWAYTGPSIGISTENDSEGFNVTGPAFSATLPIFNYGQADRARLCAMYKQSLSRLRALEVQAASEVRLARSEMTINRSLVLDYQKELLPLQAQIVEMSQKFYHAMALSVYKLLNAKNQELRVELDSILAMRDYWISKVQLNRAVGGHLYLACPQGVLECE
jgi:cobalt-zinc-cadmium efflux system outer membrane protein